MKAIVACLCLMSAATTCALAEQDLPHVSVFGTAVTEIQPDLLRWRISLHKRGADVAAVAEQHSKDVSSALEFLKRQGILPAETQTSRIHLSEHYEYRNNNRIREGYEASTDIAFTSKDLSIYRSLWSGLSKLEGVSVDSTTWDSSRRIEVQNSTRLDALKAAKDKAAAMASALGVRLLEPLEIYEIPMSAWESRASNLAGNSLNYSTDDDDGDEGEAGGIAPGSIEIRVRVRVSFRISSE